MNRYSLSSDSTRWWWPTGLAAATGTVAVTVLLVLALAPASPAKEREPERSSGGSVTQPAHTLMEVPCFIRPQDWNTSIDGPLPTCTVEWGLDPVSALARPGPAAYDCPSLPDPEYLGVPWVAYTDECPPLREWWKHVVFD